MKRTAKILARLASIKAQEKYIISANKDEYYLPEDLLEQALCALELENHSVQVNNLKEKIKGFDFPDTGTLKELVYEYQSWIQIREMSKSYLISIGFDLKQWEENEL